MSHEELSDLCHAVESGDVRLVQDEGSLYAGRVIACHDNRLKVEAFSHFFEWDSGHCRTIDAQVDPLGPPSNA